jgi:2-oxoglutarate ferredoxin oxidoreductase subunit gamma
MKSALRFSGFGGQGVILCAMIVGRAASIFDNKHAVLIQAFGPEARGSACSAQVTIADSPIGYPYVRSADVLVAMSRDAFTQFAPTVRPGGLALYESELVDPTRGLAEGVTALGVPATRFAEEIGRKIVLNIVMAGFFAGASGLISFDAMEKALRESVPKGTEELNLRALKRGHDYSREIKACWPGRRE